MQKNHFLSTQYTYCNFILGELSQSLIYSRLQNRLNPVPESLNSPDIAPPTSNDGMARPPRDDALRFYNRDIRVRLDQHFYDI